MKVRILTHVLEGNGGVMGKNKFAEKLKEGVSVKEIEEFSRQHTVELFSVLALIIATITSCWDFFTGPKMSLFFTALGMIATILYPVPIERGLKQLYQFLFKQEKSTQLMLGAVKIVIAIFIPFILFGIVGLLAGSSYHYYIRHAQIMNENKPTKPGHGSESGEHD
jgi:hypothetical protein